MSCLGGSVGFSNHPEHQGLFTFPLPGPPFKIACDVHGWMRAWAAVFSHRFHAVTDVEGQVAFRDVPAGEITVRVWHEKASMGSASRWTAERKITIRPHARETLEIGLGE